MASKVHFYGFTFFKGRFKVNETLKIQMIFVSTIYNAIYILKLIFYSFIIIIIIYESLYRIVR